MYNELIWRSTRRPALASLAKLFSHNFLTAVSPAVERRSPWPSLAPLRRVMIRARAHEGGTGRDRRGWPPTSTYISPGIGPHRESNGPLLPRQAAAVWESPTPRIHRHHGETTPLLWTIRTVVGVSSGAPYHPRVRDSENVPPRGRWHTTVARYS